MIPLKFILTLLLLAFSQTGFSQSTGYTTGTEGVFYIIIPMEELIIEDGIKEVQAILAEEGLSEIRVSKFRIDELQFGLFPYIIVRRFNNGLDAAQCIKTMNEKGKLVNDLAIGISQTNYRIFLKRRDIEEYRLFMNR